MDPSNSNRKFVLDYIENAIQKDPQIFVERQDNAKNQILTAAHFLKGNQNSL